MNSTIFRTLLLFLIFTHAFNKAASAVKVIEKSREFSLLLSALQCISETDPATSRILDINTNFDPMDHLPQYRNPEGVFRLLQHVEEIGGKPENVTEPFISTTDSTRKLELILEVLYPITGDWPLFFNTSAWLLGRVNGARLYWALMFVAEERFENLVVVPSTVEVLPQLFINWEEVVKVAGVNLTESHPAQPLHYWLGDPGLHEFHFNWHVNNPFWWNATRYGVKRDRKGEMFLYMHRQLLSRYNAERWSNGLEEVGPLGLEPDYVFPEPYYPDVLNVNFKRFPERQVGERMGNGSDGSYTLSQLRIYFARLEEGIRLGYLVDRQGLQVSLRDGNGSDILRAAVESSLETANEEYYGSFHNYLHGLLSGMGLAGQAPGIEAHPETSIRDPVFFRIHEKVDQLYQKLKGEEKPYSRQELDFPGVEINSVAIKPSGQDTARWPPVLPTYFDWAYFDISTAARTCRGVGEKPVITRVKVLAHQPFTYLISVKSFRPVKAYGMVRIFLLPQWGHGRRLLGLEESQQNAIALDAFRVVLEPGEGTTILTRSSLNSSITRMPSLGIKALFRRNTDPNFISGGGMKRACGFPNNLLIPKGTEEGMPFKLVVMISEEEEPEGEVAPHWPYCGELNGLPYPDRRPMGFPFDRPGTRFPAGASEAALVKNVLEVPIVIKHVQKDER